MRKKRMITIAVCAFVLTACGTAQTNEAPTPTVEPTVALEATTTPSIKEEESYFTYEEKGDGTLRILGVKEGVF